MDSNVQKFLARMRDRGPGHQSAVVALQEGEINRTVRYAKMKTRNGLILGSTVPPPDGWEERGRRAERVSDGGLTGRGGRDRSPRS